MKRVSHFPFDLGNEVVVTGPNAIFSHGPNSTSDQLRNRRLGAIEYFIDKRRDGEFFVRVAHKFLSVWSPDGVEICTVRWLGKRRARTRGRTRF